MELPVSVEEEPLFLPREVAQKMKPIKLVPLRFWAVRSMQKADDTRYTLIVLAEQELEQEQEPELEQEQEQESGQEAEQEQHFGMEMTM